MQCKDQKRWAILRIYTNQPSAFVIAKLQSLRRLVSSCNDARCLGPGRGECATPWPGPAAAHSEARAAGDQADHAGGLRWGLQLLLVCAFL